MFLYQLFFLRDESIRIIFLDRVNTCSTFIFKFKFDNVTVKVKAINKAVVLLVELVNTVIVSVVRVVSVVVDEGILYFIIV